MRALHTVGYKATEQADIICRIVEYRSLSHPLQLFKPQILSSLQLHPPNCGLSVKTFLEQGKKNS